MYRYALYYAPPPGSALAAFGARWLGRDLHGGGAPAPPDLAHVTVEEWQRTVAAPRRYGFHATLKPPFRLAAGRSAEALAEAVERFCRARRPLSLGALAPRRLSDFLVLAPAGEAGRPSPVERLAADCVRRFDGFRAPSTEAEIERRTPGRLSATEKTYLERWGYPWVMDRYRFHLTLTGPLDDGGRARVGDEIARLAAAALAEPAVIEEICLCGQPSPEADFRILARFRFAAG